MRNQHQKPCHSAELKQCSKTMDASTYHTALDFQAAPDALAKPSDKYVDAHSVVDARQQQRSPAEPEHRRRHRKRHRHRRVSPAIVPPAKQLPKLLVLPDMPEVQPYRSVCAAELAGPHVVPPSAQQSGGTAAAWNARDTCMATKTRSDTATSRSKSSKDISRESALHTDREAITCLETCIAFTVLVYIGVLVLFISFKSGMWPFHGRPSTESPTTEGISARRLSEAPVPYSSQHASSSASTEDVYIYSSTSMSDVTMRVIEASGQNYTTNTTALKLGDTQPAFLDTAVFAQ